MKQKILMFLIVSALCLSACNNTGSSNEVVVISDNSKKPIENLTINIEHSNSTTYNIQITWTMEEFISGTEFTAECFINDGDTGQNLTASVEQTESSFVLNDELTLNDGTNTVSCTVKAIFPDSESLSASASFMVVHSTDILRITIEEASSYNKCDVYDISDLDLITGTFPDAGNTEDDFEPLFSDTKSNDTQNITIDSQNYDGSLPFEVAIYVYVDDHAATNWNLSKPGYYQRSSSANCRMELLDNSEQASDALYAWRLNFEDIPVTNDTCDFDYNDVVLLVELLN